MLTSLAKWGTNGSYWDNSPGSFLIPSHCDLFVDQVPIDETYGYPNLQTGFGISKSKGSSQISSQINKSIVAR